jgi:hypothetical protein
MNSPSHFPDLMGMAAALAISLISGFISISRRILAGQQYTLLWVITEFATAILCGYLMYHVYPVVDPVLSDYVTLPVAVAVAAHSGGRLFQEAETAILEHYSNLIKRPSE